MIKFKQKRWILIIALICTATGQLYVPVMSFVGIALFLLCMILNDEYDNYKLCLLLIPMIRIFDNTGITFLVNLLLAFPLIVSIAFKRSFDKKAFRHTFILVAIELIHVMALNNLDNAFSNISAIVPLMFCESIIKDEKNKDFSSATRALSLGIIMSAGIYLLGHGYYYKNLINEVVRGARFSAYAGDPNYYSLYIVMAIIGMLCTKKHIKTDYIVLTILVSIGLLTASKMCTIMMIISLLVYGANYWVDNNPESKSFIRRVVAVSMIAVVFFGNSINKLFRNIINRLSGRNTSVSIDTITTGRSELALKYFNELLNDPVAFLFGYGFQYRLHFDVVLGNRDYTSIAHNTFLDVFLSWGIIGAVAITIIVSDIIKTALNYSRIPNYRRTFKITAWYPLVALLIMFMALSCLSAGMFWYVIAFAITMVKYNEMERIENETRRNK